MSGKTKAAPVGAAHTVTTPATLEEAVTLLAEANDKLAEAEKELAGFKAKIETLEAELADAAVVIDDLKAAAELNKGGKGNKPVVSIDNKKYVVKAGTVIAGKGYTPQDLAANPTLCKELIEKGSKLFIEITE